MKTTKIITRTILILSLVSLFTDTASEMLYPIMPLYLQEIGFSVIMIGILEGCAEAISGLSKGYFGNLSDKRGKRLPFVRLGYFLSAISKPLLVVSTTMGWIFGMRVMDRLGKGLRTSARDALLSDESTSEHKGVVFGFHRAMDTVGAVFGPSIALLYLRRSPGNYHNLFLIAFLPGMLAVGALFLIKEKNRQIQSRDVINTIPGSKPDILSVRGYWKHSPQIFKKLIYGLGFFAVMNSSDAFLLLAMKSYGLQDTAIIGIYIFYNIVYASTSTFFEKLSDTFGFKKIITGGLILFSIVYGGMALSPTLSISLVLFGIYGLYAAATESIAKAWISNIAEKKYTATALGLYNAINSIGMMFASFITGEIWFYFGPMTALGVSSIGAILVTVYLTFFITNKKQFPKVNLK